MSRLLLIKFEVANILQGGSTPSKLVSIVTQTQSFRTDSRAVPEPVKALDLLKVDTHSRSSHALLHAYLEVINSYLDRVEERALFTQDEGGDNQTADKAVAVLKSSLLVPFRGLVNHYLDATLPMSIDNSIRFADKLYEELITSWARFVALVTDKQEEMGCRNVGIA
jgi:hypothetical protein